MEDLKILIYLILALAVAVGYWTYKAKYKLRVFLGNLTVFSLYSFLFGHEIFNGPGTGGVSFEGLMLWFLLLIIHISVSLIAIVVVLYSISQSKKNKTSWADNILDS